MPVYYYEKGVGAITGHIDILRYNFGHVEILDYKPNARKENPAKVVTQLTLYARALMFRAKLDMKDIRCGYFETWNCIPYAGSR